MNGRRVSRHEHVEFPESVGNGSTIKARHDLARARIDVVDIADITIIDFLVVVVLDLHDLVAGRKGPAKTLERLLQLDVQRTRAYAAAVHRTQHLDVADGIEAEPFRYSRLHQFNDPSDRGFWIVRLHEIEVALGSGWAEVGNRALVHAMGT